jgi:hypothetical protein
MKFSKFSSILTSVVLAFLLVAVVPYISYTWFGSKENQAQAIWHLEESTGCAEGYLDWPSSMSKDDDDPWNLSMLTHQTDYYHDIAGFFIPTTFEQMMDINGDGLPDYVLSYKAPQVSNVFISGTIVATVQGYSVDCVYLNTGKGWEKSYQCVQRYLGGGYPQYFGDCAQ